MRSPGPTRAGPKKEKSTFDTISYIFTAICGHPLPRCTCHPLPRCTCHPLPRCICMGRRIWNRRSFASAWGRCKWDTHNSCIHLIRADPMPLQITCVPFASTQNYCYSICADPCRSRWLAFYLRRSPPMQMLNTRHSHRCRVFLDLLKHRRAQPEQTLP